jgi:hypothetical protein
VLSALFQPVCPDRMAELASRLGLDTVPTLDEARRLELGSRRVRKGDPLYPRATR